jgi:hypothetical protein
MSGPIARDLRPYRGRRYGGETGQVTGTKDKNHDIIWSTEARKAQAESRNSAEQGKEHVAAAPGDPRVGPSRPPTGSARPIGSGDLLPNHRTSLPVFGVGPPGTPPTLPRPPAQT